MNPLDATTPEALFGPAVGDPRALKRAYAALVRAHPPERDARIFAHIRRMYELARAGDVGAGPPASAPSADESPSGVPTGGGSTAGEGAQPADSDRAGAPDLDAGSADVDAILTAFDPARWRSTVEALERRARTGDLDAIPAGYGLLAALDPDAAFGWLTGLADVPGAAPAIANALGATFAVMEERSRDPSLDALLDALPPALGRELRSARLQAMAPFHPARAAALWERELAVISADPELVRDLLLQAFGVVRWHLDAAALHGVLALAEDARFELSDGDVLLVRAGAHAALAALSYEGPHALAIYRALQAGHRAPVSQTAAALRDLVAELPEPGGFLMALERDAPGLVGAIVEMVDRVSNYDGALLGWAVTGAPLTPGDREARWLDEIDAEVETALAEERVSTPEVSDGRGPDVDELRRAIRGDPWDSGQGCFMVFGVVLFVPALVSIAVGHAAMGMRFGAVGLVLLALAALTHVVGRAAKEPRSGVGPDPADEAWDRVVHRAVRRAAALGYWPHEVAAALHLRRDPGAWRPIAAHLGEPAFTLGAITEAHVRRVVAAEMVARHEAERDGAERAPEGSS